MSIFLLILLCASVRATDYRLPPTVKWTCKSDKLRKFAKTALIQWSEITGVKFIEDNDNPDIRIYEDDYTDQAILAQSSAIMYEDGSVKGSIILNRKRLKSFDDLTIMLHEVGHLIGLVHSKNKDSIMYHLIEPRRRKRIIQEDIDNAKRLYS